MSPLISVGLAQHGGWKKTSQHAKALVNGSCHETLLFAGPAHVCASARHFLQVLHATCLQA